MSASSTTQRPRYRPKVAPRKAGQRRGRSRVDWDRAGRIALVLAVFAIALLYVSPVASVISTWKDSRGASQRLEELKADNAELKARSKQLKEPAAALQEARKLGLVAEGEQAYKIDALEPAAP